MSEPHYVEPGDLCPSCKCVHYHERHNVTECRALRPARAPFSASPVYYMQIADVVREADGRTLREHRAERQHRHAVGQLVALRSGARLFVARHDRDCDGTPLYALTAFPDDPLNPQLVRGIPEEAITGEASHA